MAFPPITEIADKRAKIVEIVVICRANLPNFEEATVTASFSHYNEFSTLCIKFFWLFSGA